MIELIGHAERMAHIAPPDEEDIEPLDLTDRFEVVHGARVLDMGDGEHFAVDDTASRRTCPCR